MTNKDSRTCLVYSDFLKHEAGIGNDMQTILRNFHKIGIKLTFTNSPTKKIAKIAQLISFIIRGPKDRQGVNFAYCPQVLPRRYKLQHLVRVHDIFPISNPEWFKLTSRLFFKIALKSHLQSYILFDSETSKNEYFKFVGKLESDRYSVLHCKIREFTQIQPCGHCKACKDIEILSNSKFAISVGTIEPRKNYNFLIDHWNQNLDYEETLMPLYVVGSYGWKSKLVKRKLQNNNSNVIWLGKICDSSLETLYLTAQFFVSASKAEGFNLPVQEALFFGLPVVLSDIAVHRELYGNEGSFFSLEFPHTFNKAIVKALEFGTQSNLKNLNHNPKSEEVLQILSNAIEKVCK